MSESIKANKSWNDHNSRMVDDKIIKIARGNATIASGVQVVLGGGPTLLSITEKAHTTEKGNITSAQEK